jgi:hypothetical protein
MPRLPNTNKTATFLAVLACLISIASCSKGPPIYQVKGTVKYQGKPLTTGIVAFHHTDQKSPLVKGEIGPDGTFRLATKRPNDGAAPGEYRVTVTSMTPGHGVEGIDKDYRPPQPLIPLKYMRLDESPLKATVEPRDDNDIQIALTP